MRRALALGSILVFPAILLLAGCYTVLKHPAVSDSDSDSDSGAELQIVGRTNRCTACHSDAEMDVIDYGAHHGYYPDPAWDRFYLWPWWYDDYWSYHGGSGGGGGLPPAGDRREQGRGLVNQRPPLGPGVRVVPPGSVPDPAPPPKKDGSGGDSKNDDTKKAPEKHDQGQSMPNTRPRP